MLKQFKYKTAADYEKAFQEAVGSDIESFEKKRERLFKKWCEKPPFPSREAELMMHVTSKKFPNTIDCAIVSDNLEFFRSNYTDLYGQNPEEALQIACICGSKKITLFLLKEILETDFTDPKMHYLLEYLMTSDMKWAEEVAHAMIKAGQREMPEGISVFPGTAAYLKIQNLFIDKEIEEEADKKATSEEKQVSSSGKLEMK